MLKAQENQRPTATQSFCWPVLLSGRDLISVSNTGYGKHLCVSFIICTICSLFYIVFAKILIQYNFIVNKLYLCFPNRK